MQIFHHSGVKGSGSRKQYSEAVREAEEREGLPKGDLHPEHAEAVLHVLLPVRVGQPQ
jgi:hypothetical protein